MNTFALSNIRLTAHAHQGINGEMEDAFIVCWTPVSSPPNKNGVERDQVKGDDRNYVFIGVFDGHGGPEAALYAKKHLMTRITTQPNFFSCDDGLVLKAVENGFVSFHHDLECQKELWRRGRGTSSGRDISSGTSASVLFIRAGKLYLGHVGESKILLGFQDPSSSLWIGTFLTGETGQVKKEHDDNNMAEGSKKRRSPVTRSRVSVSSHKLNTPASSLSLSTWLPPPPPQTSAIQINPAFHRCIILGSSGFWNVMNMETSLNIVYSTEKNNKRRANCRMNKVSSTSCVTGENVGTVKERNNKLNPSLRLVNQAVGRWMDITKAKDMLRVPNTTAVTIIFEPPTPH